MSKDPIIFDFRKMRAYRSWRGEERPALWLYPWVVFSDGSSRKSTLKERLFWHMGKLGRVSRGISDWTTGERR